MADQKKSATGLDPKIAAVLCWILAPLSSIIFIFIEKDDKFVKFHAWQSLFWGIIAIVISIVLSTILSFTVILICCAPFSFLLPFIVTIVGAVKAYNGEMWKLPVIGDIAEQQANK